MSESISYLARDIARCAGNTLHDECNTCLRNVKNSPAHPNGYQVWIGFWVLDTPCASRVPMEMQYENV